MIYVTVTMTMICCWCKAEWDEPVYREWSKRNKHPVSDSSTSGSDLLIREVRG